MGFILNTSFQPTSGFLNLNVATAPLISINYAMVGGGGSGGANWGGGGGAGQIVQSVISLQTNTLYLVEVGNGALGANYSNPVLYDLQGKSSSFAGITAIGGGSGGNGFIGYTTGNNGASGGGACSGYSLSVPNTTSSNGGTATSGYAGGDSTAPRISGGGGGAGGVGGNGTLTASGNGGAGVAITITGYSAGTFAGGGGGGAGLTYTAGTGSAGGGNGAAGANTSGGDATANTGSGGGGNSGGGGGRGGNGASGIVILSIPTANYPGDAYVNGGVVNSSVWTKTISGSNTILTFKKTSTYQSGTTNTNSYTIKSLSVGGGGGGSDDNDAGGGGSGGYVISQNLLGLTGVVYTINVGTGGDATLWNTDSGNNFIDQAAQNGQPTTLTSNLSLSISAAGGASGILSQNAGTAGGYGGGNVNPPTDDPDPNASPGLIDGGIGVISSITGLATYYAGGGSGYNSDADFTPAPGAGVIGQGGGGGNHQSETYSSSGNNGIVILSIPDTKYTGNTKGNPSVTPNGDGAGNTILVYTNAGAYIA
jgi:hypothetical protein